MYHPQHSVHDSNKYLNLMASNSVTGGTSGAPAAAAVPGPAPGLGFCVCGEEHPPSVKRVLSPQPAPAPTSPAPAHHTLPQPSTCRAPDSSPELPPGRLRDYYTKFKKYYKKKREKLKKVLNANLNRLLSSDACVSVKRPLVRLLQCLRQAVDPLLRRTTSRGRVYT